ncbi:MAG TPA: hypothetical protein VFZ83_16250 [Acidimicrobiia bacterium]|nr:hypothetical protein [Acidimicrobiia bacterium]
MRVRPNTWLLGLAALVALGTGTVPGAAAVGDGLDPTFAGTGTVDLGPLTPTAYAPVSDGGLVVAGDVPADGLGRFVVQRYTPSGSLDPTFSFDGSVRLRFAPGADSRATFVIVRPNGKLVVLGLWNPDGAGTRLGVIRTTAAGGYDPTFAGDGRTTIGFGDVYAVHDARVLDDGRLAIVLTARPSDASGAFVQWSVRLLPDGRPDPSLSLLGIEDVSYYAPFPSASRPSLEGVKILPSGRYFRLVRATGTPPYVHVLGKHTSTGTTSPDFSTDGKVWLRCAPGDGAVDATLLLDPAHRPLVACGAEDIGNDETTAWIRRYTRAGVPDAAFSGDGASTVVFVPRASVDAMLDPVGRPIAYTRASAFVATRLNLAGAVDPPFGTAGTAEATFPSSTNVDCRTGPTRIYCVVLRAGPASELAVAVATS